MTSTKHHIHVAQALYSPYPEFLRHPILDFAMIIASISIINTTNTINTSNTINTTNTINTINTIPINYKL